VDTVNRYSSSLALVRVEAGARHHVEMTVALVCDAEEDLEEQVFGICYAVWPPCTLIHLCLPLCLYAL